MLTIEVSVRQGQVHIGEFRQTLRENKRSALMLETGDWTLVDVAGTAEEAVRKSAFWEGVLKGAGA